LLPEMMDAMPLGYKVAEKIYEVRDGQLWLTALRPKPRRTTAFVVDAYLNVVGLLVALPNRLLPLTSAVVGEPQDVPHFLPRSKFGALTFRPANGDPRGRSILRPIYNVWWLKTQVWPEYLRYMAQFASPSLVGTTPEGATRYPKLAADGSVMVDEDGMPIYMEPEQAMLDALQALRSGTAAAFPHGSMVTPLEVRGEGAPFHLAIDLLDKQIAKGILGQTLATEQAAHQARAAAQTHQDVLGKLIQLLKGWMEQWLERDILFPLIEYNFGLSAARQFLPRVRLRDTEEQDFPSHAAAVAQLTSVGYLEPSQFAAVDARLGLPERAGEPQDPLRRRFDQHDRDGDKPSIPGGGKPPGGALGGHPPQEVPRGIS
jgi:hypothetical protein